MKRHLGLSILIAALVGLILLLFAPRVLLPVEKFAKTTGDFSEAYEVAGIIRNNFHEYRVRCLENGQQLSVAEFAHTVEPFTTKRGTLVKWNSSPRDGVVVESNIAFEGYYIYLDLNGNLQTRKAE
jgi:hypothetical protein